jgi:hypothetical protein
MMTRILAAATALKTPPLERKTNSTTYPREGCLKELLYHCIKIATEIKATRPIEKTTMKNETDSVGHVIRMTEKILASSIETLHEESIATQDESTDIDGTRKGLILAAGLVGAGLARNESRT